MATATEDQASPMDVTPPAAGGSDVPYCVECEDQQASVRCETCDEVYCRPCFQMLHRKGKRLQHKMTTLKVAEEMPLPQGEVMGLGAQKGMRDSARTKGSHADSQYEDGHEDGPDALEVDADKFASAGDSKYTARTINLKSIPLRLTDEERRWLDILNGALEVSEYTNNVATQPARGYGYGYGYSSYGYSRESRIAREIKEMKRTLAGLFVCHDFRKGSKLIAREDKEELTDYYRTLFEIGRRFKIVNPEKMRTTYGKLMHMLQDVSSSKEKLIGPIKTVGAVLSEHDCEDLLKDPLLPQAIQDLSSQVAKSSEEKQAAMKALAAKYAKEDFPELEVNRVLLSLGDFYSYRAIACRPVIRMIELLQEHFDPSGPIKGKMDDLRLRYGAGGSRLDHSHSTQYHFVHQSLRLWLLACERIFELWHAADSDLLQGSYSVANTGQGMHRVQRCPNVGAKMNSILGEVQTAVGRNWVGLSVVHLGDRDVPNALTFIDKYTQIPRILTPIADCIDGLEDLASNKYTADYIEKTFESVEKLRYAILRSYFKHGFDGAGSDGGSCIDGRLTSTWNWCSKIQKKSYYRIFQLTGFVSFDGSFN